MAVTRSRTACCRRPRAPRKPSEPPRDPRNKNRRLGHHGCGDHACDNSVRGIRDRKPDGHIQRPKELKLGFMSLPPEVRLMIYERVLVQDEAIPIWQYRQRKKEGKYWRLIEKPAVMKSDTCQNIYTNILYCNRTIKQEAGYTMYGRNLFTVRCLRRPDRYGQMCLCRNVPWQLLIQWLRMIGPQNRGYLTDLRIQQEPQCHNRWIRGYMQKSAVLLGKNNQLRRTLTVELKEGYIPGVTERPTCLFRMPVPYPKFNSVTMELLKRVEQCLRDLQGVQIFFEARLCEDGLSRDPDSQIVAKGWEIIERKDYENWSCPYPKGISIRYKLRIPNPTVWTDTKTPG